ncbi:MAG: hypothetical protein LUE26_09885 [Alistipes sp.]|nr:hypothetical protein [Alistipes sp.]
MRILTVTVVTTFFLVSALSCLNRGTAHSGYAPSPGPLPDTVLTADDSLQYERDSTDFRGNRIKIFGKDSLYRYDSKGRLSEIRYTDRTVMYQADSTMWIFYDTEKTGSPILSESFYPGTVLSSFRETLIDSTVMMGVEIPLHTRHEYFHRNGRIAKLGYQASYLAHGIAAGRSEYYDEEGVLLETVDHTILPHGDIDHVDHVVFGTLETGYYPSGRVRYVRYYETGYDMPTDTPKSWTCYDEQGNIIGAGEYSVEEIRAKGGFIAVRAADDSLQYERDSTDFRGNRIRIFGKDSLYTYDSKGRLSEIQYTDRTVTYQADSTMWVFYDTEKTGSPVLTESFYPGTDLLRFRETLVDSTVMMGIEIPLHSTVESFHKNGRIAHRGYQAYYAAHGIAAGRSEYYDEEGVLLKTVDHTILPHGDIDHIRDVVFGTRETGYYPSGAVRYVRYYEGQYDVESDTPEVWTWYDEQGNIIGTEENPDPAIRDVDGD